MEVELSGHYGYGRILKTMTPMVLMMVVISIYSIVDGFFVSNFAGNDAFAALNLIWPPIAVVGALGMLIGTGGSALVSKTLGEGDEKKASSIFTMLIYVMIAVGAVLGIAMAIVMPSIARVLGSDENMLPLAVAYGRILAIALPVYMLQTGFQPFFMAAEKPQMGTYVSLASGVTNIVLDALFIGVFGWGIVGAAVASSIGLIVGGCYPLYYFASRRNTTHLKFVKFHFDMKSFTQSCLNGLSEFVGNIAFNVICICYNWQLMRYIGAAGVSAYGIVMYLGFIFTAVYIGYNMGISQVISYNYGAQNHAEMTSLLRKTLVIMAVAGVVMTIIAEVFAPAIGKVFVGYDQSICELSVHATRIYVLSFLVCGYNMFTSAWFTALNNGVISAVASFVRTLVYELSCVFILPALFGIDGIWMSVNVAEVLALIFSAGLIVGFRKRYGYTL